MLNLKEFTNEVKEYKNKNKLRKIDNAPEKVINIFSKKLIIILNLQPIPDDKDINLLINEDIFFSKFFKEKENRLSKDKNINQINYEVFLRKKYLEFSLKGEIFSEKKVLETIRRKNGLSKISDSNLKSEILLGKILLEEKVILQYEDKNAIIDTKEEKIKKTLLSTIKEINNIIMKDFKKEHFFLIENLSYITPLIDRILKSFKKVKNETDELEDEFRILKKELLEGINGDIGKIKSSLFKLSQIINNL